MDQRNKPIHTGLLTLAALCLLPLSVSAQTMPQRGPIPFAEFDLDNNGVISEAEFNQVRSERRAAKAQQGTPMKGAAGAPSFKAFDTDGDGQITPQELTAGRQAQREKRRDMGGQGMGSGMGGGKGMGKGMNMPAFSDFDLNGDGAIEEQEFNDAHAARIQERAEQGYQMRNIGSAPSFGDIDLNNDGKVDADEFARHQAQHHQQMMQNK